ncbi:hypothetical protein TNCV_2932191 [Trichonephila clavipes]|nr:hypothetical protein TNCV_2932191 [Trichonephila clavipes]
MARVPLVRHPFGRRFATREDISNDVRQQVTRFTQDTAIAETNGIHCLPYRWQRVGTVAGDYIEGLQAQFVMSTLCALCCRSLAP